MRTLGHALHTGLIFAVMLLVTTIYATIILILLAFRPRSPLIDSLAGGWGKVFCRVAGVRVEITGLHHIDPQQSYMVVSNHLSAFDIMAHLGALPVPIRFLTKAELFRIPLFSTVLRRIGMVKVDRGGGRAVLAAVNRDAGAVIAQGKSLMVYPEGTRPRDGVMQNFKKGAFAIANILTVPILPTAVTGSRQVWKPDSLLIKPGRIRITVLEPIPAQKRNSNQISQTRDQVQEMIRTVLEKAGETGDA